MPCTSLPVGWSSFKTIETAAPGMTWFMFGTLILFWAGPRDGLWDPGPESLSRGGRGCRLRGRFMMRGIRRIEKS